MNVKHSKLSDKSLRFGTINDALNKEIDTNLVVPQRRFNEGLEGREWRHCGLLMFVIFTFTPRLILFG